MVIRGRAVSALRALPGIDKLAVHDITHMRAGSLGVMVGAGVHIMYDTLSRACVIVIYTRITMTYT